MRRSLIVQVVVASGCHADLDCPALVAVWQANLIISRYDELFAGLQSTFHVSATDIWAPPSNLVPITNASEVVAGQAGTSLPFPGYENGYATHE